MLVACEVFIDQLASIMRIHLNSIHTFTGVG